MLHIENLEVNYGYISALKGVSLDVKSGEIVTLIGGNGAGKTTTLMSISGLVEKSGGKVTFKDKDITRTPPHQIVHMGISHVPEGRLIFPTLSVQENLIAGSSGKPGITKETVKENFEMVCGLFPRLRERLKQGGGTLSGGEQQMLAIARGLMMNPELLMLDEPSLGLAPIIVEEIFELIIGIKKSGRTILLIEQNAAMSLQVADRGYVLETGRITLAGTGRELMDNPEVRKAYLGI